MRFASAPTPSDLATDRFGMRKRASNFTCDDLPRVVAYAHGRGVAVHVACNVVMGEADVAELPAYLELVEAAGADALIGSDLGALHLARRHAPHVKVHVSTQASVANADAALVWHELGASRIVCAREMSVAQIAAMRSRIPDDLELEAFAHGSMCMAYSGRCLISDYLTGRAAWNGGSCTQPCRWAWELHEPSRPGQAFPVEEDPAGEDGRGGATYLFNSCDLNMLAHLDDLAAAGVDAVKLEGRGRKAFYTATVVGAYRRVLDGEPAESVAPELEKISHASALDRVSTTAPPIRRPRRRRRGRGGAVARQRCSNAGSCRAAAPGNRERSGRGAAGQVGRRAAGRSVRLGGRGGGAQQVRAVRRARGPVPRRSRAAPAHLRRALGARRRGRRPGRRAGRRRQPADGPLPVRMRRAAARGRHRARAAGIGEE